MGVCSLNMAAMMRATSTNLAGHGRRTFKSGLDSRVTAVLGGQWGDEGKGKLADVLAKNYDIVGRFNGGANAGHTVVANGKKYAFHLLPCGLIYEHTMNILGNGVVVDLDAMFEELEPLDADGLEWRGRLKISDRAPLLFPFHKQIDQFMEDARGDKSIGTTKRVSALVMPPRPSGQVCVSVSCATGTLSKLTSGRPRPAWRACMGSM